MPDTYTMLVERSKSIKIDMLDYRILFVLTNNIEGSVDKHRCKFPDDVIMDAKNAEGLHAWHPNKSFSMLFLPFEPDAGSLVHEVFHCVWRIMTWINAEHENEIMAYMIGYITREFQSFINATGTPDIPEIPARVIEAIQGKNIKKKLDTGETVIVQ